MKLTVLKAFNTNTQRFAVGADVAPDADLSPFTVGHLKDHGFVGDGAAKPAKPAK